VLLLRVEAEHRDDALGRTLQAIQEASSSLSKSSSSPQSDEQPHQLPQIGPAQVLQYGLRSSDDDMSKGQPAIMEFALKFEGEGKELVSQLLQRPDIYKVRQVSTEHHHGST